MKLKINYIFIFIIFLCIGCTNLAIGHSQYPLSFSKPIYTSHQKDNNLLYIGYDYRIFKLKAFLFDLDKSAIVTEKDYDIGGIKNLCETKEGIVIDTVTGSSLLNYSQEYSFSISNTTLSCPNHKAQASVCNKSETIYNLQLPGHDARIVGCLSQHDNRSSVYVQQPDGTNQYLGIGGIMPGPGYVAIKTMNPNEFLIHNTSPGTLSESAFIVNIESNTTRPITLPDLSEAVQSRGFGAGDHRLTIHTVNKGFIAVGKDVFYLRNNKTEKIAENPIMNSLRITNNGCDLYLIVWKNGDTQELRHYNLCGI